MAPALLPLNPSFGSPAPACAFQRPRCQKRPLLSLGTGPRSAPRRSFSSPAPASSLFPPAQTRLWSMEYPPGRSAPGNGVPRSAWGRERKNAREPAPVAVPSGALVRDREKEAPPPRAWPPARISRPTPTPFPPADSGGTRESRKPHGPCRGQASCPISAATRPRLAKTPSRRSSDPAPAAPLIPPARCTKSPATLRQGWRDRPARRSSGSDPSRASNTRPRPCPARSGSSPLFPPAEGAPPCVPGSP